MKKVLINIFRVIMYPVNMVLLGLAWIIFFLSLPICLLFKQDIESLFFTMELVSGFLIFPFE